VARVRILKISGQNDIRVLAPWLGGFPQVQVVGSLVNQCLPMVHPRTKVFQLHTNQLVVWFV